MVSMSSGMEEKNYYYTQKYHNPDWWDKWLKNNLKKKLRLFINKRK
jgi:hypothetical protein